MSTLILPDTLTIAQPRIMPVGTITLTDAKGPVTYEPKKDITAYELALIVRVLFRLSLGNPGGHTPDWRGYLEEHKLTRHFKDPNNEAKP